jgi:hypothetical protein
MAREFVAIIYYLVLYVVLINGIWFIINNSLFWIEIMFFKNNWRFKKPLKHIALHNWFLILHFAVMQNIICIRKIAIFLR